MPETLPATGAIPSEPDYRDAIVSGSIARTLAQIETELASLPGIFKTLLDQFKVLDQNKIPACVSHAWALCMMYWWYKKTGEIVEFSPRFLDILSGVEDSWIPIDGGRVPRTVCRISKNVGCCTTKLLPNDTEGLTLEQYRDPKAITQAMRDEAAKYKIPGYVRIQDNSVLDFRRAIKLFGVVSGLFAISDRFWVPSWNPADIDPLKPATPTSNHQMVVFGWEGAVNWLRNSWSKFWNRNGDGTYDAQKWLEYVYEGWAIAEIPADVAEFLKNLPKPYDFSYRWNTNLARGDYSDDVKFAQVAMMILGFMDPAQMKPEDLGHYGPMTAKGVAKLQAFFKIDPWQRNPDRIGPLTRGGLNKQFAQ